MAEENEFWDKEEIYDEQISPLMQQIIEICKDHNLPMVAQFQYQNDEENGPGFVTTALPFEGWACDKMQQLAHMVQPQKPVVIASTEVTKPDGSKHITIRRVT